MMYNILYTKDALKDIKKHKKSGQKILLEKIENLINEIRTDPRIGTGQSEQLKWMSSVDEVWSRRINKKHRLTYEISEHNFTILILSAYGHYYDK